MTRSSNDWQSLYEVFDRHRAAHYSEALAVAPLGGLSLIVAVEELSPETRIPAVTMACGL